ncbi:MAG: DUF4105 domain-containing protein [Gemmatimonadota bacterium]|nr:DUF4105 domain-containing protein [Gemmatimonadota bacterium]MDH3367407.1 DUF4105 domain-containing protein [Gemmatimonadota bacterium]MDH3479666.1 DUF4105 domain-containing protein [Gemmatimonadota bacterium]MDH3570733.1 DUF4105 domain-containing protein [Gemmatimonadota bacterium]MDH5550359.1 DUF4105 domain-containing protein [Gemmatimonadota bacterium]
MARNHHIVGMRTVACLALGLAVGSGVAWAQEADSASSPEFTVYLVTFGPGQVYWERFGHNAIWIRDPAGGINAMFNYGMFDFQQENFLGRFIQGRMLYQLAAQDPEGSLQAYSAANRSIWLQELNLTDAQRTRLRDFLVWNAQPENRDYRYDYFLDNCSTRLRDALDDVLGGRIRTQTEDKETGTSFRFHTQRLTTANVLYYTGLLAALGRRTDRPISAWEEMFIPMSVRDRVRDVTVLDQNGDEIPLVKSEVLVYESTAAPALDAPPRWLIWYLITGVALAAVLAFLGMASGVAIRWILAVTGGVWMLIVGLAGFVLAGLWLATDHAATYWNENLFYLTPIALPLAIVLPLAVLGVGWARRPALLLAAAVGVSSVLGLVLQIVPGVDQVNGQLIALILPANVVLGFVSWRRFGARPASGTAVA